MKKTGMLLLLAALMLLLTGCTAVDEAFDKIGEDMKAAKLDAPKGPAAVSGGDIDWGFVPVLREKATETFLAGFPDAQVLDAAVATKSSGADRVIVTLTYQMNGKKGEYGFDYQKNDQGEYELSRYGDGVNSDDLH